MTEFAVWLKVSFLPYINHPATWVVVVVGLVSSFVAAYLLDEVTDTDRDEAGAPTPDEGMWP